MVALMPRPRPPHLQREVTRHGKAVWYVRVGKGPRIRLKTEFGSSDFDAEYQAAVSGQPRPKKGAPEAGTLAWLIDRYRETTHWGALSAATRRQRENIFARVIIKAGHEPYARVTQMSLAAARDGMAKATPAQARNFLDAMRGLFKWAADPEVKIARHDPTLGVKNPPRRKGQGFRPWEEEDVEAYEARWPIGTRQRVWLDILLYTGLRRGDAVRFGRQHIRNGIGKIKTEKSGFTVTVTLPILPVLQATLDAGPCGEMTFICGEAGSPFTKESFGNEFRQACNKAKVPGSAHGVRKIAATRAANNGATVAQLEAIFGWQGGTMASLYTKTANRERLSREAMSKLLNTEGTSIPAPDNEVRAPEQKAEKKQ